MLVWRTVRDIFFRMRYVGERPQVDKSQAEIEEFRRQLELQVRAKYGVRR